MNIIYENVRWWILHIWVIPAFSLDPFSEIDEIVVIVTVDIYPSLPTQNQCPVHAQYYTIRLRFDIFLKPPPPPSLLNADQIMVIVILYVNICIKWKLTPRYLEFPIIRAPAHWAQLTAPGPFYCLFRFWHRLLSSIYFPAQLLCLYCGAVGLVDVESELVLVGVEDERSDFLEELYFYFSVLVNI